MRILIMNGPNLNLLGEREPGIYGSESLEAINRRLAKKAEKLHVGIDFFQSNHEGEGRYRVRQPLSAHANPFRYTHVLR